MWVGYELGLMQFVYHNSSFKKITPLKNYYIFRIVSSSDSLLFLISSHGFIKYNIVTGDVLNYSRSGNPKHALLFHNGVNDMVPNADLLYLATHKGLLTLNIRTGELAQIPVPLKKVTSISKIAVDKDRNIWVGTAGKAQLFRLNANYTKAEIYDSVFTASFNTRPNNVIAILIDVKNTVWVITVADGLLQYDEQKNSFIKHRHQSGWEQIQEE
jgi:ligand-binding sensor domain-containing protein